MSAASAIARGRAAAAALMVDTCTITRVTGQTTDPQTGQVTKTVSTIYSGKCRTQWVGKSVIARPIVVGEAQRFQQPLELQIPMSVAGINVGDVATITASALDADLVGRSFWVKELAHKTHATARRLGLEEVTS